MPVNLSFPGKDAAGNAVSNPFREQLEFFRKKLNLPSERWDDILKSAHDRGLIVAGAGTADLMQDLNTAISKAIEAGGGLEVFRKDFDALVQKNGWTGWTGEGSAAGRAWRTRIIYQTNLSTSYAAGRWQQLKHPDLLSIRPYWKYVHADGVAHPRPLHVAWNGLVLHHEHPFWDTHYPPNGWMCHCRVTPVDAQEYAKAQAKGRSEPPANWQDPSPRTDAPSGIDKGFDYAPGANAHRPLKDFIDAKLIKLSAPIGSLMHQSLEVILEKERQSAWEAMLDRVLSTMQSNGEAQLAHVIAPEVIAAISDQGTALDNAAVWLRDSELLHTLRDYKANSDRGFPMDVLRDLRTEMNKAEVYFDTKKSNMLYVFDLGEVLGKIAVELNYNETALFNGVRSKVRSNFIKTGGIIQRFNILDERYVKLK